MRSRLFLLVRSSHQKAFCEKALRPVALLKKRLWHSCFPVNFVEFLRTLFLTTENLWQLLLVIPIRLYRVEHFCYPQQAIPISRFLLFCVGYIWSRIFAFYYSQQVILSRTFLLFQVGYTKNVYTVQKFPAILCSLLPIRTFRRSQNNYKEQKFSILPFGINFLRLALTVSERYTEWNATMRSGYSEQRPYTEQYSEQDFYSVCCNMIVYQVIQQKIFCGNNFSFFAYE